jgi:hypothetical protein
MDVYLYITYLKNCINAKYACCHNGEITWQKIAFPSFSPLNLLSVEDVVNVMMYFYH